MGFRRRPMAQRHERPSGKAERDADVPPVTVDPGGIEDYVARFNAEEIAAGCLPSPTLGRFLAVLELRDVLRRNRRLRADTPSPLSQPAPKATCRPHKLRRNVVQRLFAEGRLLRQHVTAADEIEELLQAVSRGMFATARRGERVQDSPTTRDLFDRLAPRHRRLMSDVYWPWLDWLASVPVILHLPNDRTIRHANPLPPVIDIVVDNASLRSTEKRHGLRNGTGPALLRAALHRYCLLAGYLHLPEPGDVAAASETGRWRRRRAR